MTLEKKTYRDYSIRVNSKFEMGMTFYPTKDFESRPTFIYLHGGGLLYGHRDDLPQVYIDLILSRGYNLVSFDYPLAPEVDLKDITSTLHETIQVFLENKEKWLGLKNNDYILFGRSAGAYLALVTCKNILAGTGIPPKALISLYGYTGFDAPEFQTPAPYYKALPRVSDKTAQAMIRRSYITQASIEDRFSLYVKARQEGTWPQYLGQASKLKDFNLTRDDLRGFPPTLTAASTHDPDVPYKMSKVISRTVPRSKCITVYGDVHDFDRDISQPIGLEVYEKFLAWLDQI